MAIRWDDGGWYLGGNCPSLDPRTACSLTICNSMNVGGFDPPLTIDDRNLISRFLTLWDRIEEARRNQGPCVVSMDKGDGILIEHCSTSSAVPGRWSCHISLNLRRVLRTRPYQKEAWLFLEEGYTNLLRGVLQRASDSISEVSVFERRMTEPDEIKRLVNCLLEPSLSLYGPSHSILNGDAYESFATPLSLHLGSDETKRLQMLITFPPEPERTANQQWLNEWLCEAFGVPLIEPTE